MVLCTQNDNYRKDKLQGSNILKFLNIYICSLLKVAEISNTHAQKGNRFKQSYLYTFDAFVSFKQDRKYSQ